MRERKNNGKNNNQIISGAIQEQYGAAIKMLEIVMKKCPEEIWDDRTGGPPFWQVVYHTMWYLDWYLSGTKEERETFKAKYNYDGRLNPVPDKKLTHTQLLDYMTDIKIKARDRFNEIDVDDLIASPVFEWHGNSVLSSLLYNLRHVMLHIGALNFRLHSRGIKLENWVSCKKILGD